MRYLITGGAGFIGSHLADALVARGDDVVVLDDLSTGSLNNIEHLLGPPTRNGNGPGNGSPHVQFVEGSTSDAELVDDLMSSADYCFHLASAVGVQLVVDRPLDSLRRNVFGCETVMGAAARREVPLLFASTSEIYGKDSAGALHEFSDRHLGAPQTARWGYANAKTFGEMLAFGYAREQGSHMVVVRLFNTVGPRQTGRYGMVVPRLVAQALAGEDLTVYGDGTQSRCFAHVADSIEAIVLVADLEGAAGNVFNIGSPTEVTILELAREVAARTETDSEIVFVPFEDAYGDGFEELGRRQPDTAALEALTGWKPRFTVEHAIEDVIEYQQNAPQFEPAGVGAAASLRVA